MSKRDEILDLYEEIDSPAGPAHNPRWYRLNDGWAHSAYLQRVDGAHLNPTPLEGVPEGGILAEVAVPITRSYRATRKDRWAPLYYLYYQSLHWITAVEEGLDGALWYRLTDDLLNVHTYVPSAHLSLIPWQEYSPFSPHVPDEQKRIEVSVEEQTLTAYENEAVVLQTKVSTGLHSEGPTPNGLPTDTPTGYFRVQTKMPSRHMGDGELTDELEAYELLGVPWVCFFHKDGIALHGTYWRGRRGCPDRAGAPVPDPVTLARPAGPDRPRADRRRARRTAAFRPDAGPSAAASLGRRTRAGDRPARCAMEPSRDRLAGQRAGKHTAAAGAGRAANPAHGRLQRRRAGAARHAVRRQSAVRSLRPGSGRAAAGGIDALPAQDVDRFIQALAAARWGRAA